MKKGFYKQRISCYNKRIDNSSSKKNSTFYNKHSKIIIEFLHLARSKHTCFSLDSFEKSCLSFLNCFLYTFKFFFRNKALCRLENIVFMVLLPVIAVLNIYIFYVAFRSGFAFFAVQ